MLELIQEMIHENNTAPAEGIAEEKISEFEARYDSIVQTAAEEYGNTPPSDYYRDGYNLYLRMGEQSVELFEQITAAKSCKLSQTI